MRFTHGAAVVAVTFIGAVLAAGASAQITRIELGARSGVNLRALKVLADDGEAMYRRRRQPGRHSARNAWTTRRNSSS